MAITATPAFPQLQKTAITTAVTACTTYVGSFPITNTVTLLTAGTNGAIVTGLWAIPLATVTATDLELYIQAGGSGSQYLIDSVLMPAQTIAATTQIVKTTFPYSDSAPLRLNNGDVLAVGIAVSLAGGIAFFAQFTNF